MENTIKRIYEVARENNLWIDDVWERNGVLFIEVERGDWKHEHARLDLLMDANFNVRARTQEVTEEDGSDTYSAIHKYILK